MHLCRLTFNAWGLTAFELGELKPRAEKLRQDFDQQSSAQIDLLHTNLAQADSIAVLKQAISDQNHAVELAQAQTQAAQAQRADAKPDQAAGNQPGRRRQGPNRSAR